MPNWTNETMWTGDNLPILRGMNSESVDLIYLDPPFNSKHDYAAPIGSKAAGAAFKDTWSLSDIDLAWLLDFEKNHPDITKIINATLTDSDKAYLIYMAPRLIEMHRILKSTGSIYLHCDPTMSHYLKLLMDTIFGRKNFRNEIVWKRTSSAARGSRKLAAIHDIILFYAVSSTTKTNPVYTENDPDYIKRFYRFTDEHGRYRVGDLTASGVRYGDSGEPWRGINPSDKGNHWRGPGAFPPHISKPDDWDNLSTRKKLERLDSLGLIHWPERGNMPGFKRYLSTSSGQPMTDLILDIPPLSHAAKERTGYPTQKPIALLNRIIKASSNEGDMVLDPFCGCATACVAAHNLNRQWTGIDISEKAYHLVRDRIIDMGGLFYNLTQRTDLPKRTDLGKIPKYNSKENKQKLYGEQEGLCNGCREHFFIKNLTVDHIIARKVGGTDHVSNLQLLCGYCNSVKGSFGMEYLLWKLGSSNTSKPWYKPGFPHYPSDGVTVMNQQMKINEPY